MMRQEIFQERLLEYMVISFMTCISMRKIGIYGEVTLFEFVVMRVTLF